MTSTTVPGSSPRRCAGRAVAWLRAGRDGMFFLALLVGPGSGLGLAFFVVIPVIGDLLYGPLIYNWAREARGHGVPEVMIAVADNGGRIRPQVSVVKALASALCIGTGGSVGREGPIVQIGSALASSLGQWVKMPENRLRRRRRRPSRPGGVSQWP
jgi:H+/Cl- antiporter ClcA